MDSKRPIAVDLFAGAGGLSLGFEQAGFDVVAAVEIDPVHACIHKFNFPQCAVIPRSVTQVTGADIRHAAGLANDDKIDAVIGGAPCQGFSLIGQRALDDPRNSLVKEFIRIVHELEPSYFVFENVKGLTVGKHRKFLEEIIENLKGIGYRLILPWQVLNAKNYGVPQHRERLFLVGARDGAELPSYPEKLNYRVNCKDALHDLPDAEKFEQLLLTDAVRADYLFKPDGYSALMRCSDGDYCWKYGYRRQWDSSVITSSRRSNHSQTSRDRFKSTLPGTKEPISRFFKLAPDGISNTLRAGTDAARGAFTSPRPIHYDYARCITVREMARVHGFPDWFRFNETKWHGARQIGNSVPPPLAFAVAQELVRAMSIEQVQPDSVLALGDESLVRMGMSSASRYWGIDTPIKNRDRKI